MIMLPNFKYHPDPLGTEMFRQDGPKTCCCCGRQTDIWYDGPYYGDRNLNDDTGDDDEMPYEKMDFLCPDCIADGSAARKYQCMFQADELVGEKPEDADKQDEWLHHTPGYYCWQEPLWYTHCGDYCEFLGSVGWKEIEKMGLEDEIADTYDENVNGFEFSFVREGTYQHGHVQCFLFRCRHCGRHFITVDPD